MSVKRCKCNLPSLAQKDLQPSQPSVDLRRGGCWGLATPFVLPRHPQFRDTEVLTQAFSACPGFHPRNFARPFPCLLTDPGLGNVAVCVTPGLEVSDCGEKLKAIDWKEKGECVWQWALWASEWVAMTWSLGKWPEEWLLLLWPGSETWLPGLPLLLNYSVLSVGSSCYLGVGEGKSSFLKCIMGIILNYITIFQDVHCNPFHIVTSA